jgi:hypothetical protein
MKISKITAAASLALAVGAFAPSVFAQAGGAGGVPAEGVAPKTPGKLPAISLGFAHPAELRF